ncbi:MAG TPA: FliM/FliN family flagellar motor switch protein [Planctomycetaceae bacterium]|jgi:flagellar motor switch protein FliN/FliY|nr:FliM/FliN family flagellar motor switch protein [Planctomycetaceae bacterium]
MAQLTDIQIQRTIDACREHLVEIAETFRTTIGSEIRLSAGEPTDIGEGGGLADFQTPGMAIAMTVGEQGLVVLVPQTLPLPAWYRQPDISQNNRLQTLAHELTLHLLPADLQSERYLAIPTENLIEVAQSAVVAPSAKMVELSVFHPDGTHEAAFAKILIIVPVNAPPVPGIGQAAADNSPRASATSPTPPVEAGDSRSGEAADVVDLSDVPYEDTSSEEADSVTSQVDESGESFATGLGADSDSHGAAESADAALRALRVLRVPVTVSVRLAERKMSLGAVVALGPGSLVTFNKSCEDLLDLYVNNHRYCQGEAIKIGESFGLKISKVGVTEERKERII